MSPTRREPSSIRRVNAEASNSSVQSSRRSWYLLLTGLCVLSAGCDLRRPARPKNVAPSQAIATPAVQPSEAASSETQIAAAGTVESQPDPAASRLRGLQLFQQHCSDCHGNNGDGKGVAAKFVYPKPRNFRAGKFRLVTTLNGVPTLDDLEGVLTRACRDRPCRRGRNWRRSDADPEKSPYGVFRGMTIFEAAGKRPGPEGPQMALGYLPADDEWRHPNIHEDTATGSHFNSDGQYGGSVSLPEHKVWFFHLARICNHCTYPACLASCPRNAIYKRPEDGIVLVNQSRCRGYRKCVEGCPYKKVMFRPTTGTSEKCIGCFPRLEGKDKTVSPTGAPAETRCMSACVGKIRLQGLVKIDEDGSWANDPQNPVCFLVRERKIALPLYPQFGTEPNGFYIPPRWVPRSYLMQMFGPGVDHAIEQYSCPDRELLAVLQLFRANQQIVFRFEINKGPKVAEVEVTLPSGQTRVQEIFNDTVIGFNKLGEEVVRTTIEEPTFEPPAGAHVNSI